MNIASASQLISDPERSFFEAVSRLVWVNPFLPDRIHWEREALGGEFVDSGPVWRAEISGRESENVLLLYGRVSEAVERVRLRLEKGARASAVERELYRDAVVYLLYNRFRHDFLELALRPAATERRVPFFRRFEEELERLAAPAGGLRDDEQPAHLFACFFQIRRAFHLTHRHILGGSLPTARLRAAVWQSIFTHDMRRYRRSLFRAMGDVATLVTGPTGTGKELVARAIGLSRFVPFDPDAGRFVADYGSSFFPLNLSALSPTLIESELFGHRKGAFTGAVEDRSGWLDLCPELGAVFLDEIGEISLAIQVKLLRVLENRTFYRLGESRERRFAGKILAATHRDPAGEMRAGRMREDFYFRICSDLVETPSLADQLADRPEDLEDLLLVLAERLVGPEESAALADEVSRWIHQGLGAGYRWPGNVRELDQCVRNVMIRGRYQPPKRRVEPAEQLAEELRDASLTAEQLLGRYVTLVYHRYGSYQETGRRLGLDRRTVKAKIDSGRLAELEGEI